MVTRDRLNTLRRVCEQSPSDTMVHITAPELADIILMLDDQRQQTKDLHKDRDYYWDKWIEAQGEIGRGRTVYAMWAGWFGEMWAEIGFAKLALDAIGQLTSERMERAFQK